MRSKIQNTCLDKNARSPRLLRFQTSKALEYATMWNGVFFYEGSLLNLKTTPQN